MLLLPICICEPDDGEQDVVTGSLPPDGTGWLNVTGTRLPSGDETSVAAGHASVNAAGGGGCVGAVVDLQADAATTAKMATTRRALIAARSPRGSRDAANRPPSDRRRSA